MKKTIIIIILLLPMCLTGQVYYKNSAYTWRGNTITQGKFKATANSDTDITSNYKPLKKNAMAHPSTETAIDREHWVWERSKDSTLVGRRGDGEEELVGRRGMPRLYNAEGLPYYKSSIRMENTLYNMALKESLQAIAKDTTFRTGIFWGGVWTRDVSYSILHSLAHLQPYVSMNSLRKKVTRNNRIVEDTGTGGSYPCSTDRTSWVLAAWEIYKVTGDKQWLDFIFPIIRNTVDDDRLVAYDPKTGLLHGESTWLDWRTQEYPAWIQPADIYNSECLGTNVVHYQTVCILASICELEGQRKLAQHYAQYAYKLKDAINRNLWIKERGHYGIYLYGRDNLILMEQQEILGQSLAILFDVANPEQARSITETMAQEKFGTPDLYPNLLDLFPYHNDAMWPFTEGYWMKACQKVGHEQGVLFAISSIYRAAALFLTNQENLVITTGDYMGLPINSPCQLWSVAASASIVPNIYFGIQYDEKGIRFAPFVPKALKAERRLSNFRYRDAVLDMSIKGYGNVISSFRIDGKESEAFLDGTLKGEHRVEIVLDNRFNTEPLKMNYVENDYLPATPEYTITGPVFCWKPVPNAKEYRILLNGEVLTTTQDTSYTPSGSGEYAVIAVGNNGWQSYMSEPLRYYNNVQEIPLAAEGKPYTLITRNKNIYLSVPVTVNADGEYLIYWQYANGSGSIETDNMCAIRELKVDGHSEGVSVFPHRGRNEWDKLGYSNSLRVHLTPGHHIISLEFNDRTENMNWDTNTAHLYKMIVAK